MAHLAELGYFLLSETHPEDFAQLTLPVVMVHRFLLSLLVLLLRSLSLSQLVLHGYHLHSKRL